MKKLTFLSFLLLFSLKMFAQDGPKVVVFNAPDSDEEKKFDTKNLIKISLLEPFSGDISFYYERVLQKNLSLEIGLGVTLDDYIQIFMDNLDFSESDRTALLGNSFALGLRYYPFMASDEFYFSPEFKYRRYHSTLQPLSSSNQTFDPLEENKNVSNFRITVGYVYFFDNKIFIDYYAGIGIASVKYKYYDQVYNNTTMLYEYTQSNTTALKPRLNLGIKFGFTF
jgi:hypothetical protein